MRRSAYELALDKFRRPRLPGEPPKPRMVPPPQYIMAGFSMWPAETCAVCWEAFPSEPGRFARWTHRRAWGHEPVAGATPIREAVHA